MISSLLRASFLMFLLPGMLSVAAQEPSSADAATDAPASQENATVADDPSSTGTDATVAPLSEESIGGVTEVVPSVGSGGEETGLPEGIQAELAARVAGFQKLRDKLEQAIVRQREIYIRYLNRDDRTPAAKQAFYSERLKVRALLDETYNAALDTLRLGMHEEAATFLLTMIQHRFKLDIYDEPTLEGAARLIDGGSPLTFLFQAAARSAVVVGDFDLAKRLLEAIDEDQLQEVDQTLKFLMDQYKESFEAEQVIRQQEAKEDRLPRVAMRTTQGDVVVELFLDQAPSATANFIGLVEQGFYDDLDFHQVIDHLLAMTGDSSGDGSGNSGKFLIDECDREDAREAFRGSLLMSKLPMGEAGEFIPNSASSQFAILFLPMISASKEQTVFGRVVEGMDVISRMRRMDSSKKKAKGQVDLPPDRIIEATVLRRPETLPEPKYLDLSQL